MIDLKYGKSDPNGELSSSSESHSSSEKTSSYNSSSVHSITKPQINIKTELDDDKSENAF